MLDTDGSKHTKTTETDIKPTHELALTKSKKRTLRFNTRRKRSLLPPAIMYFQIQNYTKRKSTRNSAICTEKQAQETTPAACSQPAMGITEPSTNVEIRC